MSTTLHGRIPDERASVTRFFERVDVKSEQCRCNLLCIIRFLLKFSAKGADWGHACSQNWRITSSISDAPEVFLPRAHVHP